MSYYIKTAIIICVIAAASFFVAQTVIPDKNGAAPNNGAVEPSAASQTAAEKTSPVSDSEDAPAVVTDTLAPETPTAETSPSRTIDAPPPPKTAPEKAVPAEPQKKTAATVTPPPTPAPAPARQTASAKTPYKIELAALCANIVNRGPDGITDKFTKDSRHAYYFTHVTGARDTAATIIHRWYHNGALIQTSILPVKSPNWRTYSKRNFINNPVGQWRVEAVEPNSKAVLESATFVVE